MYVLYPTQQNCQYASKTHAYGIMSSMHYRFLTNSTKAWLAMLVAIGQARESIYLEMYILEDDTRGFDFFSEIERKAHEGLRVKIILDAVGSFGVTAASLERLRAAGAEILFYGAWFKRTHRKILIVDEERIYLGGVNIGKRFTYWNDLQLELRGKKIAAFVLASFASVYKSAGGIDPYIIGKIKQKRLLPKTRLWFIEHGIGTKRSALRMYYETHIEKATRSISLVTPYFIPHPWLIRSLRCALERGVTVTIIVPKKTDHWISSRMNSHFLSELHALGAKCYQLREMNHAKAMLIDGREGLVGSNNLDALSFDWNIEAGIFFTNEHMARDLAAIIEGWRKSGEEFTHERSRSWYDPMVMFFFGLFRPVL